MIVAFDVLGIPMPQGSKKAFTANGRAMLKEAGGNRHAAWRNAVADKAREVAEVYGPFAKAPIQATVTFRFPMPKSRTKTQRARITIPKITAPDLDKLLRAVFDGLIAGGLIPDDALITGVRADKIEVVDWYGATITIRQQAQP